MNKGDIIKGYKILEDFKVIGGQSKVSFAEKNGVVYFIKEFLTPKYPIDGSPGSPKLLAKKRRKCQIFENHHNEINKKISSKVGNGGNLVFAIDFFREGAAFYKINEKIDIFSLSLNDIARLDFAKKSIICLTLCNSLKILHSFNIVHGDIKPDNVLIKKTETGSFTTKLIDFDEGYYSKKPPKNNEIVGDQVYYSPEIVQYIKDGSNINKKKLTLNSDVFALGILFTQYLTGKLPLYPNKYNYCWEAVIAKETLKIPKYDDIPDIVVSLLQSMLNFDYKKRPNIDKIFKTIKLSKRYKNTPSKNEGKLKINMKKRKTKL